MIRSFQDFSYYISWSNNKVTLLYASPVSLNLCSIITTIYIFYVLRIGKYEGELTPYHSGKIEDNHPVRAVN